MKSQTGNRISLLIFAFCLPAFFSLSTSTEVNEEQQQEETKRLEGEGSEMRRSEEIQIEIQTLKTGAAEMRSTKSAPMDEAPGFSPTQNISDAVDNFIRDGERDIQDLLYGSGSGWEAPLEILENYPIYLSGYDDENRPIWVGELGKFDMRRLVEGGEEMMESFNEYVRQLISIMIKSIRMRSTEEEPVERGIFIIDFDHMRLFQLAHLPTIRYCLGLMRQNRHLIEEHMDKVYIINANFVAESGLNLARPILGHMMSRFEIYGTNRARWLPKLLHAFPKDQLPEWYGGNKNHRPLLIYG